jgi:hypothetical protein
MISNLSSLMLVRSIFMLNAAISIKITVNWQGLSNHLKENLLSMYLDIVLSFSTERLISKQSLRKHVLPTFSNVKIYLNV